jgi:threonine-phosphate decarboxylase
MLDFSASINPLGPSPKVLDAIRAALPEIAHYPEPHSVELTAALASAWGVSEDSILLGNGASDLIHFLGSVFRTVPTSLVVPVFSEFHRVFPHARCIAATPDHWPARGVTVITRPLNPSGELICFEDWLRNTTHPVIVDESFIEFTGVTSLVRNSRPNLIVLRSLTKFHAIPGLRVGAMVAAPEMVAAWKQLRDPWTVNALAIRAACAALADLEHARLTLATVTEERAWLRKQIALLDVESSNSQANYLLAKLPYPAAPLAAHLEDLKILVRDCTGWLGLPPAGHIRVAVRTRPDNERLIAAWKGFPCAGL